uniref:Uncharacterized protein n=1 Tax=Rhizophora mucronata TaxID=61149 RepID=A0A2P2M632_RHIMU
MYHKALCQGFSCPCFLSLYCLFFILSCLHELAYKKYDLWMKSTASSQFFNLTGGKQSFGPEKNPITLSKGQVCILWHVHMATCMQTWGVNCINIEEMQIDFLHCRHNACLFSLLFCLLPFWGLWLMLLSLSSPEAAGCRGTEN